jgi:hypothetical protein
MSDLAYKQCQSILDEQNKNLKEGLTQIRDMFVKYINIINKDIDRLEARIEDLERRASER